MIKVTKDKAIEIVYNQSGLVAEELDITEELFKIKYNQQSIGKMYRLGEVLGILVDVKYFTNAEKPYGQLIWKLPYEIQIVERKVDTKI